MISLQRLGGFLWISNAPLRFTRTKWLSWRKRLLNKLKHPRIHLLADGRRSLRYLDVPSTCIMYLWGCFVPFSPPSWPSQLLGGSWWLRCFSIPFLLRWTNFDQVRVFSWSLGDAWNILTTKSLRVTNKYSRKGTLLTLRGFRSHSHHLLHWFSRVWDLKMNVPWPADGSLQEIEDRNCTTSRPAQTFVLFDENEMDSYTCMCAYNLHTYHIRS